MKKRKQTFRDKRAIHLEALEPRLCLAASLGWDGPGPGSAALSYYIGDVPASLDRAATEAALETALKAWSDVADLRFTRTSTPGLANSIDFSFRALDGRGRALAQAYYPDDVNPARIAGDIQFDSAETWEIGNGRGNAAFDLVQIAVHEIGHALGLRHSSLNGSIMAGTVSPNQSFRGLSAVDVQSILALYGAQDGQTESPIAEETGNDSRPRWRFTWRSWRGTAMELPASGGERLFASETPWQNGANRFDINGDGHVTPLDAIRIINQLNDSGARLLNIDVDVPNVVAFLDCNGDSQLSPLDALAVINRLNTGSGSEEASSHVPVSDGELNQELIEDLTQEAGEIAEGAGTLRRPLVRFDANDDGVLTENEVPERLWTRLQGADSNEDGAVSAEELIAFRTRRFLERIDLFGRLDENNDGLLSQDELPEALWDFLLPADGNQDGGISREELAAFRPRRFLDRIDLFDRLDDDGDGELTEGEVPPPVWTVLQSADTNEDGAVSREELLEFRPRHVIDRVDLFGRLDANDDGLWTEGEIPETLWNLLKTADANEDGGVSPEELQAFRPRPIVDVWQYAFDQFDKNDDDVLTEEELPAFIWKQLQRADADGDGGISLEELVALRPDRPESPDQRPTLFDRLDSNDDGQLTADEVPDLAWRILSRLDRNGDGALSREELNGFSGLPRLDPQDQPDGGDEGSRRERRLLRGRR